MDNLKSPAYPHQTWEEVATNKGENKIAHSTSEKSPGFTKLEKAALMIAQGLLNRPEYYKTEEIAPFSVAIAKAVIEEANK